MSSSFLAIFEMGPSPQELALFRKYHGGPYDPKSRMDRGKMAQLRAKLLQRRKQPVKAQPQAQPRQVMADLGNQVDV